MAGDCAGVERRCGQVVRAEEVEAAVAWDGGRELTAGGRLLSGRNHRYGLRDTIIVNRGDRLGLPSGVLQRWLVVAREQSSGSTARITPRGGRVQSLMKMAGMGRCAAESVWIEKDGSTRKWRLRGWIAGEFGDGIWELGFP
jgi:hypothetical protein